MNRRSFLSTVGVVLAVGTLNAAVPPQLRKSAALQSGRADRDIRIERMELEIGPGVQIETLAYNGQVPGPLLRLREGVPVTIDVTNTSSNPDLVHWHGLAIDSLNDGAMEEGSPMIAAGATQRYSLTPKPAGTRWYHTHAAAYDDLTAGTCSGQFGFLLVEGRDQPAPYDP